MSNEGWICPVCRRGKAPHVETCDCASEPQPQREFAPLDISDGTKTTPSHPYTPYVLPFTWPQIPQPPYKITWSPLPGPWCGGRQIQ